MSPNCKVHNCPPEWFVMNALHKCLLTSSSHSALSFIHAGSMFVPIVHCTFVTTLAIMYTCRQIFDSILNVLVFLASFFATNQNRCHRESCRYFHPPEHISTQLVTIGSTVKSSDLPFVSTCILFLPICICYYYSCLSHDRTKLLVRYDLRTCCC